jgi:S-(hydroxymethyl)glutathione dehydrogenase/alcohol dehydrogenase
MVDFGRLVDFQLQGKLKVAEMISQTYTLDTINDAFAALKRGDNARGVILPNG